MARLIVEAVRDEKMLTADQAGSATLELLVSVSNSTTGLPLNGLQKANFRVTPPWQPMPPGFTLDHAVVEMKSLPDNALSGVYRMTLTLKNTNNFPVGMSFEGGVNYAFGIHVTFDPDPTVRGVDAGQTVVSVMGFGHEVMVRT